MPPNRDRDNAVTKDEERVILASPTEDRGGVAQALRLEKDDISLWIESASRATGTGLRNVGEGKQGQTS